MEPSDSGVRDLILEGVHRSVGAREAGLQGVLAQIESEGRKIRVAVIPFAQLLSPKSAIERWDRGCDFFKLVALMKIVRGRKKTGTYHRHAGF